MKQRFFIFLISLSHIALSQDFTFERITTKDGLSQNNVNCIFQDNRGFMWFGTNDGLNRYDGYDFKTFRLEDGLNSNLVRYVGEDDTNNLWISTTDKGINVYNYRDEKFNAFTTGDTLALEKLKGSTIINIQSVASNKVRCFSNNGIYDLSISRNKLSVASLAADTTLSSQYIKCFYRGKENKIWIGTIGGLYFVDEPDIDKPISYKFQRYDFAHDVHGVIAFGGGLLLASLDGLFYMSQDSSVVKFSELPCKSLLADKNGDVWVTSRLGLFRFEPDEKGQLLEKEHFVTGAESHNLSDHNITSMYQDKSGIIWIGTESGGINKLDRYRKEFKHYKKNIQSENIKNNRIRCVLEDSHHNLWMGAMAGGVSFLSSKHKGQYDTDLVDLSYLYESKVTDIYALHEISLDGRQIVLSSTSFYLKNKAFILNDNGGFSIEPFPGKLKTIESLIMTFASDKDYLWIGTYGNGLYRYTLKSDELAHFEPSDKKNTLSSKIIRSLLCDSKGRTWIGTDNGLNLLTKSEKRTDNPDFIRFKHNSEDETSISLDYILPIFESSKGLIWIGTLGGGLNLFKEANQTFQRITTADGLPNNVVKSILEDGSNNLWIASNRGISMIRPLNKIVRSYDIYDGLQDYEFSEMAGVKLQSGEMLFAGVNGFNTFYPKSINEDRSVPDLVLTELYVLNRLVNPNDKLGERILLKKSIDRTEEIKLKYAENSFTIHFVGLLYRASQKMRYKYMLEGFDDKWISTSAQSRFAKYTSIPPGSYKLKVLASNGDGIWSDKPKELSITIIPPLWLSNQAFLIYAVLIFIMLLFYRNYAVSRLKMKNALQMERFEKDKIEELSQMKFRFFTNISHEFRTPLTLIIGHLENLLKTKDKVQPSIKEGHKNIYRNARIMRRLVDQLMDFRKLEQGQVELDLERQDFVTFCQEVFDSFRVLSQQKNITTHFECQSVDIVFSFDYDKMEKILYNILSNAFKYTLKGGTIRLKITDEESKVNICISDTGIGIPKELQTRVFDRFYQAGQIKDDRIGSTGIGMAYTKGLVAMHGGTIDFESQEEKGTSFFLTFPKKEVISNKADEFSTHNRKSSKDRWLSSEVQKDNFDKNGYDNKDDIAQILIVEDNAELRNLVKDILKDNYSILEAENGREGLEICLRIQPELVISDVMMPVMDGYEMCRQIKNDQRTSHIPVILLTAKTSEESQIKGFVEGADAYVSKPFSQKSLTARIGAVISSRRKVWEKFNTISDINPSQVTFTKEDEKFLKSIISIIEEHISDSGFSVKELSEAYDISQVALNKKLKAMSGKTTIAFIRSIRLKRAAQLIGTGRYTVAQITYAVGFTDLDYFRQSFKKEFSMMPNEYKKKHA